MTDFEQQLHSADRLYLVVHHAPATSSGERLYLAEAMGSYDSDLYRFDLAHHGIDYLVNDEWENVWTQGENVHLTEADAQAQAEADGGRVLEITKDDVRVALLDEFGPATAGCDILIEDLNDPAIMEAAMDSGDRWARELGRAGVGENLVRLLRLDNSGALVVQTNANPVWEDEDGFAELAAELGLGSGVA